MVVGVKKYKMAPFGVVYEEGEALRARACFVFRTVSEEMAAKWLPEQPAANGFEASKRISLLQRCFLSTFEGSAPDPISVYR